VCGEQATGGERAVYQTETIEYVRNASEHAKGAGAGERESGVAGRLGHRVKAKRAV
jgi:hypothetical protein